MATYKYDTLASKTVAWASRSGLPLTVTVALIQETQDYFDSGDYKPTIGGLDVTYRATVDGKDQGMVDLRTVTGQGDVVGQIGKIGLMASTLAEIQAAAVEVKAHPAHIALIAAREAGYKAEMEHDTHTARVEAAMTLDGKSY